MSFPPKWSMETLLIVALAAAVIVVVFAQGNASDKTRVTVEPTERSELVRQPRPSFSGNDIGLGR